MAIVLDLELENVSVTEINGQKLVVHDTGLAVHTGYALDIINSPVLEALIDLDIGVHRNAECGPIHIKNEQLIREAGPARAITDSRHLEPIQGPLRNDHGGAGPSAGQLSRCHL